MTELPIMPLWVKDILADTNHLSNEEMGAYNRLLYNAWLRGGRLVRDDLARMACCSVKRWTRIEVRLRSFFTVEPNGDWCQKRLQKELNYTRVKRETFAARAAKARAGKAKKNKAPAQNTASVKEPLKQALTAPLPEAFKTMHSYSDQEEKGSATHIAESPSRPDGSEVGALPPRAGDAALAVGGHAAPPAHEVGAEDNHALLAQALARREAAKNQRMNGGELHEPPASQPFTADEPTAPKALGGIAAKLAARRKEVGSG